VAVKRMINVMSGRQTSCRHKLFLEKQEREQCNSSQTSVLYQLSNPGFLGGSGIEDSAVLNQLLGVFKVCTFRILCLKGQCHEISESCK